MANCDLDRAMRMLSLDDDETNAAEIAVEIHDHSLHDGGIEGATRKLRSFCPAALCERNLPASISPVWC